MEDKVEAAEEVMEDKTMEDKVGEVMEKKDEVMEMKDKVESVTQ